MKRAQIYNNNEPQLQKLRFEGVDGANNAMAWKSTNDLMKLIILYQNAV